MIIINLQGLNDVNDWEKAHDYGIYRYEDNGQTLQYFDVLVSPNSLYYLT